MTAAEAAYKHFQAPIGLEGLTPVKKPIPSGKTLDMVICSPVACVPPANYVKDAAKILGWHVKVLDAGETPGSQQAAMQQTVTEKPDAVIIEGLATELFAKQLEALKQEKVTTVLWQIAGVKQKPPAEYIIPGPSNYEYTTKALAAAAVVAGGPEAKLVWASEPAFPIVKDTLTPEFDKAVKELCPKCTIEELQIPVSALGKNAVSLIVNYVRGHSGTSVVVNDNDLTSLGLEAALKGAGITDVKDVGLYPTEANYPNIESGAELALVPDPYHEIAFLVADSLARIYAGESPEPDIKTTAPVVIWTKQNLPAHKKGEEPPVIANYEALFKRLWKK